ncbi:MAG: hypothetical protein HYX73_04265 [Acidobacteria bacterium]|nr:hypothetical protein [Acidobacteriota bacterium]
MRRISDFRRCPQAILTDPTVVKPAMRHPNCRHLGNWLNELRAALGCEPYMKLRIGCYRHIPSQEQQPSLICWPQEDSNTRMPGGIEMKLQRQIVSITVLLVLMGAVMISLSRAAPSRFRPEPH